MEKHLSRYEFVVVEVGLDVRELLEPQGLSYDPRFVGLNTRRIYKKLSL